MSSPEIPSIRTLTGSAAGGAGTLILAHADAMAAPPAGEPADSPYVGLFASLLARARVTQARLVSALMAVSTAEAAYDKKVAAARAEEKVVDGACGAVHARLLAEIRAGTDGAQELFDLYFPEGLAPLVRPSGRSQVATNEALAAVLTSAAATSNPAYALVADKVAVFGEHAASFTRTIQEKDGLETALDAARAERDAAQESWTADFRGLLEAGARLHGADSVAFRGWVRPLVDWKASQDAARSRRANAQAPGEAPAEVPAPTEPTPTEGREGDGG